MNLKIMKTILTKRPFARICAIGVAFVLLLNLPAHAADGWVRYESKPGSKVKIEGTSSLHDWEMEGQIIGGFVELESGVQLDKTPAAPPGLKDDKLNVKAQVKIPVRSIKSGKDLMDGVMQEAMKQKQFPSIDYRVTDLVLRPHVAGNPLEFTAKGELTIAGVTNKVNMFVTLETLPQNKLKITGTTALKMTAYGVTPPKPKIGLGVLSTGDDIKLTFEWITGQRAVPADKK